jgi:hypothetical protein
MPPIVSTLEADFSDFVAETQKATVAISDMQQEADATSASMSRGAVVVGDFGNAAAKTGSGFTTMATGLRTADKTLGAFGVSIGKEIAALDEMGQVAGKTASQIGLIGTATSVAGAALAGWGIGRKIAELTGSDRIIGDAAAALLGFGDVAKETAGAIQDQIERAQKLDPTVRTAAQAFEVLQRAAIANAEAFNTGSARVQSWETDLHDANTDLAALRAEIEAGNSTVAQMAQHYNVSADAVQYLQREMQKETAAKKESDAAAAAQADALREVNDATGDQSALLQTLSADERMATENALAMGVSQSTIAKAFQLTAGQVKAVADEMERGAEAAKGMMAAQKIVSDATKAWSEESVGLVATTTDELIANIYKWEAEQIKALDDTKQAAAEDYAAIATIANQKLQQVLVNWDVLKEGSLATFADQAARAEATYQAMLANSTQFSQQAIDNARKVRDETLATYETMRDGHVSMTTAMQQREQAYVDALKQYREQAATAADQAFEQQQRDLDKAIAYAQTFGVTIDAAKQALGQFGAAGADAGAKTAAGLNAAADAASRAGQAMQLAARSAQELSQAAAMAQKDAETNIARGGVAADYGFFQLQQARSYQEQANKQASYEQYLRSASAMQGPWGATTNINVTANNDNAQSIAQQIVTEMRHAGVRFA